MMRRITVRLDESTFTRIAATVAARQQHYPKFSLNDWCLERLAIGEGDEPRHPGYAPDKLAALQRYVAAAIEAQSDRAPWEY